MRDGQWMRAPTPECAKVKSGQSRGAEQRDQWEGMPAMRQTAAVLYELCRQQALKGDLKVYADMLNNDNASTIITIS